MGWILANAVLRLALTIVLSVELARYPEMLNRSERLGIGIMGGTCFLTIPVIINGGNGTPFEGWASTLFTFGALVYFCGRMTRLARHSLANAKMRREAVKHLNRRRTDPGRV